MLKGIDVSNWDYDLQVGSLDVDFVICKATEGVGFKDWTFDDFAHDTMESDKLLGFYHFLRSGNGEKQADYFYSYVSQFIDIGIPVLDYEIDEPVTTCEQFMQRFYNLTGIWPMLYASASRLHEFNDSWIPEKCGLWVAGYPKAVYGFEPMEMPYEIAPFDDVAIWQFTDSLELPDARGYALDGNYAYMDKAGWQAFAHGNPVEQVYSIDDAARDVVAGAYGNGSEREENLQDIGMDYNAVQARVNEYYVRAREVWQGMWGNGTERKERLQAAGYDYSTVQAIVNGMAGN